MKKTLSYLTNILRKKYPLPVEGRFSLVLKSFSHRENQIFFSAMGVLVGTTIVLLVAVNNSFLVPLPAEGGTLTEGVLNTPAHINPLLANGEIGTEADRDITQLIYSGLLRSSNNSYIPDLAESYEISKDGLTYTFKLKPNLVWHDGKEITAADIVFTVKTAQDGRMKSAKRASWDGIGVEQIDDRTVKFTLTKPYAPFLENATMGILPQHIWGTIDYNRFDTSIYNREPIGSGPYKFEKIETVTKDGDQIPVSYTLSAFGSFALGKPYISNIKFVFFRSEEGLVQALKSGTVDAISSITPASAQMLGTGGYRVEHTPLPRVLAVFFNQNQQPLFTNAAVRRALSLAVDKQAIVDKVLDGFGVVLDSPIPPSTSGYEPALPVKPQEERLAQAREILTKDGWSFASSTNSWTKTVKKVTQTIAFDLATSEATELKDVSNELQSEWAALGVPVTVHVYATGDLKETVVRPRKFDALFFGEVLGQNGDQYPFWHSSQRLDPGLNIASYVNTAVDKLLDSARVETNSTKRATLYNSFSDAIAKDTPAIFMYAPEFIYVLPNNIKGFSFGTISTPSDRFLNIYMWYINTDNVWKIFVKQ